MSWMEFHLKREIVSALKTRIKIRNDLDLSYHLEANTDPKHTKTVTLSTDDAVFLESISIKVVLTFTHFVASAPINPSSSESEKNYKCIKFVAMN